jgi:putative membrane protein
MMRNIKECLKCQMIKEVFAMMFGRGYNEFNSCFGNGFGFMHNGIGMILMFLFIVIVITVIFLITRTKRYKSANVAMESLKIRLAKGEITEDEYIKRKTLIE